MPTPSLIIPSAPVYDEGNLYGLNVYGTNFVPEPIPFTRATTATRTNAAGLIELAPYNLLTWSEQFDNAVWNTNNATKIATASPSGTLTAALIIPNTTNGEHNILNSSAPLAPRAVFETYSVYAKASGYNFIGLRININSSWQTAFFDLSNGTVASSPVAFESVVINAIGDGWYRCSVSYFNRTANGLQTIPTPSVSVTFPGDGVSGVSVWGAQLVEGTDALPYLKTETRLNRPRVDFSLGGCPNLLLEPQRTNLALQSSSFDSASWAGTAIITANSHISPSGVMDADTLTDNNNTLPLVKSQNYSITANASYTTSLFIRKTTGAITSYPGITLLFSGGVSRIIRLILNTTTGTFNFEISGLPAVNSYSARVVNFNADYWRVELTTQDNQSNTSASLTISPAISSDGITITSAATGSAVMWGAQIEQGAYATSYIPTTTTSVTRNADSFTESNVFSRGMITAAGGTWFVELRNNRALVRDTIANGNALFISDSAVLFTTNSICIHNPMNTSEFIAVFLRNNSVSQTIYTTNAANIKLAIKWNGATIDVFANGVKVVSNHPFAATLLNFLNGGGGDVPKYIQQMALYPTPLSDDELEEMTGLGFNSYAAMASYYNYITQ